MIEQVYKRINVFLIHSKAVKKNCPGMLLNCKQARTNVHEQRLHLCLSIVHNDFQDNVNDRNVGVNERIFFSFVCRMTQMNAQKCYRTLIKMQKSLLNLVYAQIFAFSR